MTLNDPLANVLSKINNFEQTNKREVITKNNSKVIRKVLDIMADNGYIGGYEVIEDAKGDMLKITLLGNINETGVVKPRFSLNKDEYEKWEKRYLPARDFGIIVLSTSDGVMTHYDAKEAGVGGRLISYCY
jgi:small subunit ribosomal protein S8